MLEEKQFCIDDGSTAHQVLNDFRTKTWFSFSRCFRAADPSDDAEKSQEQQISMDPLTAEFHLQRLYSLSNGMNVIVSCFYFDYCRTNDGVRIGGLRFKCIRCYDR